MKNYILILTFIMATFFCEATYGQKKGVTDTKPKVDTTVKDAMDFITTNLNQTTNAKDLDDEDNFEDIFDDDNDYGLDYDYKGEYKYTVLSSTQCSITLLETTTGKTKITFYEDEDEIEISPIYSNFLYVNVDTVRIDFSKIARVEIDRSNSISLVTYNNMNTIQHSGQITRTPATKRKNDMVKYVKENEEDIYKKLRKYLKDNKINYEQYPSSVENYDFMSNKFTFRNLDKEISKRLIKALNFLQKNCGGTKEKF